MNYSKKEQLKCLKWNMIYIKKECEKDISNIKNVRDISKKKYVYCIDKKIP